MIVTNLPDALLLKCMSFVGGGQFIFVAGTCRSFRDTYTSYLQQNKQHQTTTNMDAIVASVTCLKIAMIELDIDVNHYHLRKTIQWRNESELFWTAVIRCAAHNGKLDVLVWAKNNNELYWKWIFLCSSRVLVDLCRRGIIMARSVLRNTDSSYFGIQPFQFKNERNDGNVRSINIHTSLRCWIVRYLLVFYVQQNK